MCHLTTSRPIDSVEMLHSYDGMDNIRGQKALTIDCEMIGGDSSQDLCTRVCVVDEDEKLIFHSYVLPQNPVTDYGYLLATNISICSVRYEITGITEENLRDAMPLYEVREKIQQILEFF
ncbi:hypothetical protein P3S67_001099 [Capsicum chacoense]